MSNFISVQMTVSTASAFEWVDKYLNLLHHPNHSKELKNTISALTFAKLQHIAYQDFLPILTRLIKENKANVSVYAHNQTVVYKNVLLFDGDIAYSYKTEGETAFLFEMTFGNDSLLINCQILLPSDNNKKGGLICKSHVQVWRKITRSFKVKES